MSYFFLKKSQGRDFTRFLYNEALHEGFFCFSGRRPRAIFVRPLIHNARQLGAGGIRRERNNCFLRRAKRWRTVF